MVDQRSKNPLPASKNATWNKMMNTILQADKKIWFFFLMLAVVGFVVRVLWIRNINDDYRYYILPWVEHIRKYGYFAALPTIDKADGNYSAPYYYFLVLIAYIPKAPLLPVKLLSMGFDYLIAAAAAGILIVITDSMKKALFVFGLVMVWPTVVMNSGVWGQCDSIYTFFLVLMLFLLLLQKPRSALFFFGISFAFKLQAVFVLPMLVLLVFMHLIRLRHFVYSILGFVIANIPGWLAGMPFERAITIYFKQAGYYTKRLYLNAPSIYAIFDMDGKHLLPPVAGVAALALVLVLFAFLFFLRQRQPTEELLLWMFGFFALLAPVLLPYMHERYFYPAEIASLLLLTYSIRYLPMAVYLEIAGVFTYYTFFTDKKLVSISYLAIGHLVMLLLFLWQFAIILRKQKSKTPGGLAWPLW